MRDSAKRRNELLKKLDQYSEFVRGSITSVCATCNRMRCICQRESSRKAYRLTYKDKQQKTRIVYVPRGQLPRIRKMITNHGRVRKIIEKLAATNIEAFKQQARR